MFGIEWDNEPHLGDSRLFDAPGDTADTHFV